MEAAAHTKGGFGGVPQAVGKEFVAKDAKKRLKLSDIGSSGLKLRMQDLEADAAMARRAGRPHDGLLRKIKAIRDELATRKDSAPLLHRENKQRMLNYDEVLAACDALSARMDALENAKADAAWAKADAEETEAEYIRRNGTNSGYGVKYNAASVEKGINSAYKGQKPSAKSKSVTHALLRGRE
jgi:hypothetical protein